MRIAITGADGFVGHHAVEAVRAAGHDVRPLVRQLRTESDAAARAVGDIGPDTVWAPFIDDCDAVIHLAGAVHETGPETAVREARMRRVNVEATACLARAAAECGVRRVVLASSIKVMGEISLRPFVESDTPRPVGAYAVSKRDAELVLWQVTAATNLEGVVLRPPLVYGPGVGANFRALLALSDTPWPLPLADASARRSLLFVRNLADALQLAATHPNAAGQTFFVSDDNDVSVADLVAQLRQCFNRPRRLFAAPRAVLRGSARLTGYEGALARLFEPLQASPAHLRSQLSWTPPATLDQGLASTASWFARQRSRHQP
jgi:nucleoside-diphosphate-sugar epimerase